MKTFFILTTALFILIKSAFSTPLYQELYTSPNINQKNEVIIFYNTLSPFPDSNTIINNIIKILQQNYTPNDFSLYLIDLKQHPHFISIFNLIPPLNLVAIRIIDGSPSGYQKLTYSILNQNDIISLTQTITEFLDNFLNIPPKLSKN